MYKRDLVRGATMLLKESDTRKSVSVPKKVFHISDDDGNHKDFAVKSADKEVSYTMDDVENILNACLEVIKESLKNGEPVSIAGFGTFGLKYREPRSTRDINTGQPITIEGRYVPKFLFGEALRTSARVYGAMLQDKEDVITSGYSGDAWEDDD